VEKEDLVPRSSECRTPSKMEIMQRCAARELMEETKIKVEPENLKFLMTFITPDFMEKKLKKKGGFDTDFFLYQIDDLVPVEPDMSEVVNYAWVYPDEALDTLTLAPPQQYIFDYLCSKTFDTLKWLTNNPFYLRFPLKGCISSKVLTFAGDEMDEIYPGPKGTRHRMPILKATTELESGYGKVERTAGLVEGDIHLDPTPKIPLVRGKL